MHNKKLHYFPAVQGGLCTKICLLLVFGLSYSSTVQAQQVVQLEPKTTVEQSAKLTIYQPLEPTKTKTAVLVIPGGAYTFLATETEGTPIAREFADRGITAFVLKYRLPAEAPENRSQVCLQDAESAMQWIRKHAKTYQIDPKQIGVIGFSVGGHLAAMLGTKTKQPEKPKFMVLVYPVISMQDSLTHVGSRNNLLGTSPSKVDIGALSAELQVSKNTPPSYLTHAKDDQIVSYHNSVIFKKALDEKSIKNQLVLVPTGDHGFIQRIPATQWLDPIIKWISELNPSKK